MRHILHRQVCPRHVTVGHMRQPGERRGTSAQATTEERAVGWLRDASAVTVLTGAGISTESGIPDFRGPHGVWTTNPQAQALSTIDAYVSDPDVRRRAWRARRDHPAWSARPNAGHRALVDLERTGRLRALVTQNIDGLHQAAGSNPAVVIEIHGTIHQVECLTCGDRTPMPDVLGRVEAGEEDPPCLRCGGILKSAMSSRPPSPRPGHVTSFLPWARRCRSTPPPGWSTMRSEPEPGW
jgi:NAD-dependent deacetylase